MDGTENFGKCLKGVCNRMCPKSEIKLRRSEKLVHYLERTTQNGRLQDDSDLMVKEYSRPAAGKREPQPCDLRPPDILMQTVDYLLGSILPREDIEWKDIYDFIFDRLRCVRQDMVIQNIGGSTGIAIFEKIVRFLIYAGYRLCTEPMSRFDPKINYQHTQECLKRLIYLYTVVPGDHNSRQEFESIYLLYNLGQTEALMHFYDLDKTIRDSPMVKLCYRTNMEYMLGNNVRCLRLLNHHICKEFPILLCAIHSHLTTIQRQSLQIMNTAYSSKAAKFPVDKLVSLLLYTDIGHAVSECRHCKLNIVDSGKYINFLKGTFSYPEKSCRKRKYKPTVEDEEFKPKMSAGERAKMYRENIKKDPVKLELFRQKEKTRKELQRLSMTEEQKSREREMNRIRQQRFREKQKAQGIKVQTSKSTKVLTRKEREKQRAYWKDAQRKHREKQSSQKKRRIKEHDRKYRQDKRAEHTQTSTGESSDNGDRPNTGESSDNGDRPNTGESSDNGDKPNTGESLDNGDKPNTGESSENGDKPNTGESSENGDKPNTGESSENGDKLNTGESSNNPDKPNTGESSNNGDQPNIWKPAAKRKALSRLKSKMPKDSNKFAETMHSIINKSTPRKRQALIRKGIRWSPKKLKIQDRFSSDVVKKVVSRNPKFRKEIMREVKEEKSLLKKNGLIRSVSTYFGIRQASLDTLTTDSCRKERSDALDAQTAENIKNFYERPGVSTNLPTAKRIKKNQEERKVLDRPLNDLYEEYIEEHPHEKQISLSTFKRNKPANVESTKKKAWYGCLCEVCTNAELKLKPLNIMSQKHGMPNLKIKDKYEAIDITLCKKNQESTNYANLNCIKRDCKECGTDHIVAHFQPLAEACGDAEINYTQWERVKKIRKGKEVTQVMPVNHQTSMTGLILDLSKDIEKLAEHTFVASWQQRQFSKLISNVPESWVVLNMDFSENYTCISQKEVQSAHWGHDQITLHPTVAYYKCQLDGCDRIVQEALIFISNDLTHDAGAVNRFTSIANDHLTNKRGLTIEREIQLTDGCSAQYKSKIPFTDISYGYEDNGFPIERHFYGSRHGKGPSDGAGAVVKSVARRAVMGENLLINSAEDLYEFGKKKLVIDPDDHCHYRRSLFNVGDIEHDRPERNDGKTLKGTRKLQCVRTVSPYVIETRNLSCFCTFCINRGTGECENGNYTGEWTMEYIKKGRIPREHVPQRQPTRPRGAGRRGRGKTACRGRRGRTTGPRGRGSRSVVRGRTTGPRGRGSRPVVRGREARCQPVGRGKATLQREQRESESDDRNSDIEEVFEELGTNDDSFNESQSNLEPDAHIDVEPKTQKEPSTDSQCYEQPKTQSDITVECQNDLPPEGLSDLSLEILELSFTSATSFLTVEVPVFDMDPVSTVELPQYVWDFIHAEKLQRDQDGSNALDQREKPQRDIDDNYAPDQHEKPQREENKMIVDEAPNQPEKPQKDLDDKVPDQPEKPQGDLDKVPDQPEKPQRDLDDKVPDQPEKSQRDLDDKVPDQPEKPQRDLDDKVPDQPEKPQRDLDNKVPDQPEKLQREENKIQYPVGTSIAVKVGKLLYPAVVADWPWISFYVHKGKNLWSDGVTRHTVLPSDVDRTIQAPDIILRGRSFFYTFVLQASIQGLCPVVRNIQEKKYHTPIIDKLINKDNLSSILLGQDIAPT